MKASWEIYLKGWGYYWEERGSWKGRESRIMKSREVQEKNALGWELWLLMLLRNQWNGIVLGSRSMTFYYGLLSQFSVGLEAWGRKVFYLYRFCNFEINRKFIGNLSGKISCRWVLKFFYLEFSNDYGE